MITHVSLKIWFHFTFSHILLLIFVNSNFTLDKLLIKYNDHPQNLDLIRNVNSHI